MLVEFSPSTLRRLAMLCRKTMKLYIPLCSRVHPCQYKATGIFNLLFAYTDVLIFTGWRPRSAPFASHSVLDVSRTWLIKTLELASLALTTASEAICRATRSRSLNSRSCIVREWIAGESSLASRRHSATCSFFMSRLPILPFSKDLYRTLPPPHLSIHTCRHAQ